MTHPRHTHPRDTDPAHILAGAKEDHDSVLELTQALVRIPSRAGIDPYEPVLHALTDWMHAHGLTPSVLHDPTGAPVALTADLPGTRPLARLRPLPGLAPARSALLDAARAHQQHPEPKIAGPSNIGNYLAGLGIPATAGFGVDYTGLHATDERFRTDTVPTIQAIYHTALATLLS